jgi:hypothetical protein
MKADIGREHSPDPRDSQNHRSRREPLSIDDSDEGVPAASIIERRRYDAMLPSRNFVNRSRLRLILDLMIGIPFLLILLGIDVLRRKGLRLETEMLLRTMPAELTGSTLLG